MARRAQGDFPTQEKARVYPEDDLLRLAGYRIAERPAEGQAWWTRPDGKEVSHEQGVGLVLVGLGFEKKKVKEKKDGKQVVRIIWYRGWLEHTQSEAVASATKELEAEKARAQGRA